MERAPRIVWQHVGWDNTRHKTIDLRKKVGHENASRVYKIGD